MVRSLCLLTVLILLLRTATTSANTEQICKASAPAPLANLISLEPAFPRLLALMVNGMLSMVSASATIAPSLTTKEELTHAPRNRRAITVSLTAMKLTVRVTMRPIHASLQATVKLENAQPM